jgi:hypothetical protein
VCALPRLCLLDLYRFVSGYPSYSTQLRLRRIQEMLNVNTQADQPIQPESASSAGNAGDAADSLSAAPEDMYSPVKPRSDSLLGQTPLQIRARARETIRQTNSVGQSKFVPVFNPTLSHQDTARSPNCSSELAQPHKNKLALAKLSINNLGAFEEHAGDEDSDDEDSFTDGPDEPDEDHSQSSKSEVAPIGMVGSGMSLKDVSKHVMMPVVKQMSGKCQTFGDVVIDVMDQDIKTNVVKKNDSQAIEGALRRFTEMGQMFADSATAVARHASIAAHNKAETERKNIVVRILVAEFLDSLPWKVCTVVMFANFIF